MEWENEYRGVEQLVARRAHNPEAAGSSPVPATMFNRWFRKKSAVFLYFLEHLENLRVGDFKSGKSYAERETSKKESTIEAFFTCCIFAKIKI